MSSPWNSLEVAKLLVGLLTPLVVGSFGYLIQSSLAEQNRSWQVEQKLTDRRLQVYDSIRNELNRIYCFVEDIGTWKEDNPETVISYKRTIDRTMHTQRAIWSPETFHAYLAYMDSAFATYGGVGTDAKVRTTDVEKIHGVPGWKTEWTGRISNAKDPQHRKSYEQLLTLLSRDLMLKVTLLR